MLMKFPPTGRAPRASAGKATRRIVTGLLLVPVLAAVASGVAAQETATKIAIVDLETVVAQSPAGKELQAKLQKFQQEIQAEADRRTQKARDIRQQIADGVNTLSEDRLAELQKDYEDAQIEIRRYRDDKQREGQKLQEEGLRQIEQQLAPVFRQIRDDEGWDLILNNAPGVVVIISPRVDLTAKVIERLNAAGG